MLAKQVSVIWEVLDRSTLLSIAIISILISILSLVVPLAAQTLVNLIAFGKLLRPVLTLSFMVLVLMAGLGALSIWQVVLIEIIQQKLMVKISLALAKHLTHMSLDTFSCHDGPELVNRYFEVVTIKKSLASLLLYGANLGLQVLLGLILLLFYHPLFLAFDCFIVLGIGLTIRIPYKKAVDSAHKECSHKHAIGAWLEEILTNRYLFKFNLYQRFVMQQTDKQLVAFLRARNTHFKQLVKQEIGFYTVSALASSLLLGIGGYLVIRDQLSLGQLVAAEIVLGALIYAFKRFGVLLENYYDLLASVNKIDGLLHLPVEKTDHEAVQESFAIKQSLAINYAGCWVTLNAEQPLLVYATADHCQDFVERLLGFQEATNCSITIDNIPCHVNNRVALRRHSLLVGIPQWFSGSIYDNLLLNHRNIASEIIFNCLRQLGLLDKIMQFPEGMHTVVHDWQRSFTSSELAKLMLARALILQPRLIVVDRVLDALTLPEAEQAVALLRGLNSLLIIVSQQATWPQLTNRLVLVS